jgi:hypothetical protein
MIISHVLHLTILSMENKIPQVKVAILAILYDYANFLNHWLVVGLRIERG